MLLKTRQDSQAKVDVFLNPDADKNDITVIGEEFLLALYGTGKSVKTLNQLRFFKFYHTSRLRA